MHRSNRMVSGPVAQFCTAACVAMPVMGHRCVGIESEGAVSGGDWAIAPRGASQQPSTTMLRNPAASGPAVVPRATIYSARQTHQFTYSKKFRRHTQYATQ